MDKLDFKKKYKKLFTASAKDIAVVNPPPMNYLMIDGRGDPNKSKEFQSAVEALYGAAYTIKFSLKKAKIGLEYSIPPLEGLWWMKGKFDAKNKKAWQWTLMLTQPPHVSEKHVEDAVKTLSAKKQNPSLQKIRLELFDEGICAQILHIGPYSAEEKTIKRLHDFILEAGCESHGKHHEIYLSDPRKTAASKLKTIIRQPILMPAGCGGSCASCGGCG